MNTQTAPTLTPEAEETARSISDRFLLRWQEGHRQAALAGLFEDLRSTREQAEPDSWRAIAAATRDRVGHITGQDPLSGRCVAKPRGYAGDALTLDLIYHHPRAAAFASGACSTGQSVLSCTTNRPASVAVRTRRQVLADAIDAAADRVSAPRVLSLACGHLREAELARAVREHRVETFYAVDQDADSLDELRQSYGTFGIEPIQMGVRDLLKGARPAENLDLAYTAGLYDYLDERVARATTTAMFDMLRSGGRLLLANFHPALLDTGYMEACMDWWLIYRDEDDMRALFADIDGAEIADIRVWTDTIGGVVYAEAIRA